MGQRYEATLSAPSNTPGIGGRNDAHVAMCGPTLAKVDPEDHTIAEAAFINAVRLRSQLSLLVDLALASRDRSSAFRFAVDFGHAGRSAFRSALYLDACRFLRRIVRNRPFSIRLVSSGTVAALSVRGQLYYLAWRDFRPRGRGNGVRPGVGEHRNQCRRGKEIDARHYPCFRVAG